MLLTQYFVLVRVFTRKAVSLLSPCLFYAFQSVMNWLYKLRWEVLNTLHLRGFRLWWEGACCLQQLVVNLIIAIRVIMQTLEQHSQQNSIFKVSFRISLSGVSLASV